VAVIEGVVQVSTAPESNSLLKSASDTTPAFRGPLRVVAGEQVSATSRTLLQRTGADVADVTSWRQRRLVFHDTPLEAAAAEFNRYNRTQLRIVGALARQKQITGIFDADHPQAIALFAGKDDSVIAESVGDAWVIRDKKLISKPTYTTPGALTSRIIQDGDTTHMEGVCAGFASYWLQHWLP